MKTLDILSRAFHTIDPLLLTVCRSNVDCFLSSIYLVRFFIQMSISVQVTYA